MALKLTKEQKDRYGDKPNPNEGLEKLLIDLGEKIDGISNDDVVQALSATNRVIEMLAVKVQALSIQKPTIHVAAPEVMVEAPEVNVTTDHSDVIASIREMNENVLGLKKAIEKIKLDKAPAEWDFIITRNMGYIEKVKAVSK